MLNIRENGDIEITRGDSAEISVVPYTDVETGEIYRLSENDRVIFTVYAMAGGETVIERESGTQDEDGAVTFRLSEADTDIARSEYVYDVKLVGDNGTETFIGGERYARTFSVL